MIKSQNILASLQKRQTCKTATAELFSKISNKKEISKKSPINLKFHHCEANIFLAKFTKFINFQKNIKSSGSLRANFINKLQMNYFLAFNVYQCPIQ